MQHVRVWRHKHPAFPISFEINYMYMYSWNSESKTWVISKTLNSQETCVCIQSFLYRLDMIHLLYTIQPLQSLLGLHRGSCGPVPIPGAQLDSSNKWGTHLGCAGHPIWVQSPNQYRLGSRQFHPYETLISMRQENQQL